MGGRAWTTAIKLSQNGRGFFSGPVVLCSCRPFNGIQRLSPGGTPRKLARRFNAGSPMAGGLSPAGTAETKKGPEHLHRTRSLGRSASLPQPCLRHSTRSSSRIPALKRRANFTASLRDWNRTPPSHFLKLNHNKQTPLPELRFPNFTAVRLPTKLVDLDARSSWKPDGEL